MTALTPTLSRSTGRGRNARISPGNMSLPQDILDRVSRVIEYHRAAKQCSHPSNSKADPASQPNAHRIFSQLPKVALPTTLLDASVQTMPLLANGRDAWPDSQVNPPQDLRTLATGRFRSNGLLPVRRNNKVVGWERTCPERLPAPRRVSCMSRLLRSKGSSRGFITTARANFRCARCAMDMKRSRC